MMAEKVATKAQVGHHVIEVQLARPAPRWVDARKPSAEVHASLGSVNQIEWDALFPGEIEGYDLYRAFEAVPGPGVSVGALTLRDETRMVAAAPLFRTAYRLDTPFQGRLRQATDWLNQKIPRLLQLEVVGIGSPSSDNCSLGFAVDLDGAARQSRFADLLKGLAKEADARAAAILAVKSLRGAEADEFHPVLTDAGYTRVTSVPVVMLPLPYASLDHYLSSLPAKTGSYLKRKMRSAAALRIEYRDSVAGIEDDINALLAATLAQSSVDYGDLEQVHPEYIRRVMERLGGRARLMLCWKDDTLLSFQLFLVGKKAIIANKIGMKYPDAREHNLYFVNWLAMIEFAIANDIPEIEMGATSYSAKLLFGGQIERRWLYFRFRNGVVNLLTKPLAPFFDFERNDPELVRLAAASAAPAMGAR